MPMTGTNPTLERGRRTLARLTEAPFVKFLAQRRESEHPRYSARLEYELQLLAPYSATIERAAKFVSDARAQGLTVGAPHGSPNASLVLHLLGIAPVDPVAHGLHVELLVHQRTTYIDLWLDVCAWAFPDLDRLRERAEVPVRLSPSPAVSLVAACALEVEGAGVTLPFRAPDPGVPATAEMAALCDDATLATLRSGTVDVPFTIPQSLAVRSFEDVVRAATITRCGVSSPVEREEIIYHEQVLDLLREGYGCSLAGAEELRRGMLRTRPHDREAVSGVPASAGLMRARSALDTTFPRCHAVAQSLLLCQVAYLAAHHAAVFRQWRQRVASVAQSASGQHC